MPSRLHLFGALGETLRLPAYRRLWLVGLCLNIARWVDLLALGWLALDLTGSPLMVGLAVFCRSVPMLALGPFGGVLADRLPRGRLLLVAQGLSLGAAVALAGLFALGAIGYWGLLAMELVLGTAWAIDFPVRRTLLVTLVPPGRLTSAVSFETVSMQIAKMTGPAAAGLVLGRMGPAACYAGMAVLYVVSLALTLALRRDIGPPPAAPLEPRTAGLRAGLRAVWARPAIRGVLLITVVMNVLVFPYQPMLPVFARDVYRVGPELLGLMVAADGVGALLAALAVAARRRIARHVQIFTGGSLLTAALLLCLTASSWYPLALLLLFAIGLAESGFATMQTALVLMESPAAVRGRALGILMACIGTGPFGSLWVGFLASRLGAPAASAIGAAVALAVMVPVSLRMVSRTGRPIGPESP